MRLLQLPGNGLRLSLARDEAAMLDQLVTQLIHLLQSYSGTALDPDPLFASLEVGGSAHAPDDPALARLFPNAYESDDEADEFRRVTEQGLLNRKLQDAMHVASALDIGASSAAGADADSGGLGGEHGHTIEVDIRTADLAPWARTLTALRLAIAARIGLEHESDHDELASDPETRGTVMVFDWLAAILDSTLAVMATGDADAPEDAE